MNTQLVGKVMVTVALATGMGLSQAYAQDLGKDVMKPMANDLRTIMRSIGDGTKNADTLKAIDDLAKNIDIAATLTPKSDAYNNEAKLVGADNAMLKYTSLLKALKVSVLELGALVKNANAAACGDPCMNVLADMKSYQSLGHEGFKDRHED